QTAVGTCYHVLTTYDFRVAYDSIRHHLRVFNDVRGVTHDAGNQEFPIRQFDVLPYAPFMFVADIASLDRIGPGVDAEYQVHDVLQRNVSRMRAVPATPTDVKANALGRQPSERMIKRFHAHLLEFLELT